jgi:hypothetical protein
MPNSSRMAQGLRPRSTTKENKLKRIPYEVIPQERKQTTTPRTGPPQHPLVPGYVLKPHQVPVYVQNAVKE